MIFINGCSYSSGYQIEHWERSRYSYFLGENFPGKSIFNISRSSQTNENILWQCESYINHSLVNPNWEKPEIIICQLTDDFRVALPRHVASYSWKPNDFHSLTNTNLDWQNLHRFQKIYQHSIQKAIAEQIDWYTQQDHYRDNKRALDLKIKKVLSNVGMGTLVGFSHSETQKVIDDIMVPVGDVSGVYNSLKHANSMLSLQRLCDQENIKLVFLNFMSWTDDLLTDPVFKLINWDNFVIKNAGKHGMYNHLKWMGFTHTEDGHHFGADAHQYLADVLQGYITDGKQVKVKEDRHPENRTVSFDYT
tara:strand:- start:1470 stop:2387 length:918 start_codon:yes stop_codon:yes gene_type:complete